jgi:phytoene dehydrogenase-like protein
MSFTESIACTEKKPAEMGQDSTIIFYNNRPEYLYRRPDGLYDKESAVICFSNNFEVDDYKEGIMRLTMMANYDHWKALPSKEKYKAHKEQVFADGIELLKKFVPEYEGDYLFKDVFTPTTVERYTTHFGGTVYGSPDKSRDGSTPIKGLALCGTDQGFLGIIGSMLSGISMANLYGLMEQK